MLQFIPERALIYNRALLQFKAETAYVNIFILENKIMIICTIP